MHLVSLAAPLILAILVVAGRHIVRGTTLTSCWIWMLVATAALLTGSLAQLLGQHATAKLWQFAGDVAIFTPTIALFGARRPHNRGWKFVVMSLWLVLALPAAEAIWVLRSTEPEVHLARIGFMWAVIGAGWVNHLFTRFAIPSCWFALGQVAILSDPLLGHRFSPHDRTLGLVCLVIAAAWMLVQAARPRRTQGWNRVWLDFRDLFGAIWGLRLRERVNAVATLSGWPVRLTWRGLIGWTMATPAERESVETCLRGYLRRFVSADWIESRLADGQTNPDPVELATKHSSVQEIVAGERHDTL